MKRTKLCVSLFAGAMFASAAAGAEEPNMCQGAHDIDRYRLLRRLSLDLRGTLPSIAEYEALDDTDAVSDDTITAYIESDELRTMMRRYHEALLWPNVENVNLHSLQNQIAPGVPGYRYGFDKGEIYRGARGAACNDYDQDTRGYDPNYPGEYRPIDVDVDPDGTLHEGWRSIRPWWGGPPIRVCAFDAQETELTDAGQPCNGSFEATECGCGEGLKFCFSGRPSWEPIRAAFREQVGLLVDQVVAGGAPYTDLLLSKQVHENGYIQFWKKNLAPGDGIGTLGTYNVPDAEADPIRADEVSLDDPWVPVERAGIHAGVLSLPGFLLRFQTARARANRFRYAFMCESFVPPAELETEDETGCDPISEDLTERCTCRYCHQTLEPLAASFGLFAEAGTAVMTDRSVYPLYDPRCIGRTDGFCSRFYVTQGHNEGTLRPYQFSDDEHHPEYVDILSDGPEALAQRIIDDGTFARCTVQRVFAHFMKREMRLDAEEAELRDALADEFVASSYSFPDLVRTIVTLPHYRRAK